MLISAFVIGACSGGGSTPTANAGTGTGTGTGTDACIGAASKWALWTGGTCLRGYTASFDEYPANYTRADFNAIAATGANVVRLLGSGLYSETAPYALNTVTQNNLDSMLEMAKQANLFVIICAYNGPGRHFDSTQIKLHSVWTSQVEQDAWVAMWKYTAERYKNNAIVVGYELMNEPNSNSTGISPTPTAVSSDFYATYTNTLYDWNPLALRITTAIRQVDSSTPILMGGNDWNSAAWMSSITPNGDSKTVYIFHQYEPQETYTDQPAPYKNSYGTTTGTYTLTDLAKPFDLVAKFKSSGVPVGNTEFGVRRYQPGAHQYLNDSMNIMESLGGSGVNYNICCWEPAGLPQSFAYYANPIGNGWNYQLGTDPTIYVDTVPNNLTTVIQKYLKKNTVRPSNRGF